MRRPEVVGHVTEAAERGLAARHVARPGDCASVSRPRHDVHAVAPSGESSFHSTTRRTSKVYAEIIDTVHGRRPPMVPLNAALRL